MNPTNKESLKEEKTLLLLALSFFTRVPVKFSHEITAAQLNNASRYFAVVGLFVGICCALIYTVSSAYLPKTVAVLLAMATSLLLTGAFHEDGWADTWDGFGGGWNIEQKLNIMKDSRLGTYGAAALFIILLLKFHSLMALASPVMALIVANTLSRVVATSLIYDMPYVALDSQSKVKPLAQELSQHSFLILLFTGLLVSLFYLSLTDCIVLFASLVIFRAVLRCWFNSQLGGYTGDCLGAAQQSSEIVIYLSLLLLGYGEIATNIGTFN
ncbi:adenosylcobinamide-GDP ribazoletransferase [Colwellia sp. RSH04]|uniref:adenosylcobinamide-GDP ribazoletransferase n=1 Tax=Colwellia sp. RSH04 TaxID=2305464 RepID=UPI000E579743|nr:adenosylcobinamide-GDP ribazoletransferase [Colwellia sp. RSH04]RHW75875.1 adenosylcobinamide-GDP ribazoletransferase [Colwellia sp. RSH04]